MHNKSLALKYLIILILLFVSFTVNLYAQDNLLKGISAVKRGDYIEAVKLLKSAVEGDEKKSYDANLYYGIALYRTGSLAEAEKYLKKTAAIDDERPEAYANLGRVYTEQKKLIDAISQFDKAKKNLPLNKTAENLDREEILLIIDILSSEAETYIADKKPDKAIASLTQAKTYDSKNPLIYVGLGDAYLFRGAVEPAMTNYKQALTYKPNFAPAFYGLGKVSFRQKKYNEAIEYFSKAIENDKSFAEAYFERGLILYLSDKFELALESFKNMRNCAPAPHAAIPITRRLNMLWVNWMRRNSFWTKFLK